MADDIVQIIENARVDATSLSEFIYYPANIMVQRRLAPSIHTLNYYLDYLHGLELIYSQPTGTVTVNGEEVKTVRQAINDSVDSVLIGEYQTQLEGRVSTNEASIYSIQTDIQNLPVVDGKVPVSQVNVAAGVSQEDKNLELQDSLNAQQIKIDTQKLDTGITATAKFGGVERTLSDKNTDYITPKDFGAIGNTESDLLGLSIIGLDTGGVIHTDNRSFTVADSAATDYDAITVGGVKLYINKEQTSFETRAEFVQAVTNGLKIKKSTIIQAGNVSYIYDKTSTEILDLPSFKPFGEVEFEHYGGAEKRAEPTRAVISHYRGGANEITDVVRIINPKPDTFTMKTHKDMNPVGGASPRLSLRELSKFHKVQAMVNSSAFADADGGGGVDSASIKPNGLFISNGVAISGWSAGTNVNRNQAIICTRDGLIKKRLRTDGGDSASYVAEGAVWGYSWGAWCVVDGAVVTVRTEIMGDNIKSARTIIGQAANGDYIIICVEGVTNSYGATGQTCGAIALKHGCVNAFISDGGGSTQLWWGNFYALPSSDGLFTTERTLANGLAVNCELSTYDTGFIPMPLNPVFTAGSGVGVRFRQVDSTVNLEMHVQGTFTTTAVDVLSTTRPYRFQPSSGTTIARGVVTGGGGVMGAWNMGAGISMRATTDTITAGYLAGSASWSTKHAPSNTAP